MFGSILIDLFTKFPALWAGVGIIAGAFVTSIISVMVFNRFGAAMTASAEKMVELQKYQIEMHEKTLVMQKTHYEGELNELRLKHNAELCDAKEEWQKCRKELHDRRNEWNIESTKLQLLIHDLETRPDMTSLGKLIESVTHLIENIAQKLELVITKLDEHDDEVEKRQAKYMEQLVKVIKENGNGRH